MSSGVPGGRHALVVHSPGGATGVREIVSAARGVCRVTFGFRAEVAAAHPALVAVAAALGDAVVLGAGADLRRLGIDGVVTFCDADLDAADALSIELGLHTAPRSARPWDKFEQRRALLHAGITGVRTHPVDSAADFVAAMSRVGVPGVLKPRRGNSADGVVLVATPEDGTAELARRSRWSRSVYERFIPRGTHPAGAEWLADYVSVETVTDARGEHRHVGILDKLPLSVVAPPAGEHGPSICESGSVYPSRLDPATVQTAVRTVERALDALGVRSRVTHTELRVSTSTVEIIEVNGRLGGEVARLVGLRDGSDLVGAALAAAAGIEHDPGGRPGAGRTAAVLVPFPVRHGPVASAVRPAELLSVPGVRSVEVLARCGRAREETQSYAVQLTLQAADDTELRDHLAAVLARTGELFAADGLHDDPWLRGLITHLTSRSSAHA
jgi:hypothetical protein